MYIGPLYFNSKEIFLVIAIILLFLSLYFKFDIWWFDKKTLLTLAIIFLLVKGLLPAIHNEAFFTVAASAVALSLFMPIFVVILYFFISFALLRVLKVL
jgi:hypothetical protein